MDKLPKFGHLTNPDYIWIGFGGTGHKKSIGPGLIKMLKWSRFLQCEQFLVYTTNEPANAENLAILHRYPPILN